MLRPVVVATVALALAAVPATAAPGARTATATYTTPGGVEPVLSGDSDINGTRYGSATVFTRRGETRVDIVATDTNGLPVAFEIAQDTDGDGAKDWYSGPFCGRTPAAVRFKAQRRELIVLINAGECGAGVSAPTTGTVTARLA